MTEEEISKLAREYADKELSNTIVKPYKESEKEYKAYRKELLELFTDSYSRFLQHILRDHCIVKKSEVKEVYNNMTPPKESWADKKPIMIVRLVLEQLFGIDLFKERSEE